MNLELFLARKYLSSKGGRGLSVITWIALIGVMVGVMSLITVLSVMSGFERELREKMLGNQAHINIQLRSSLLGGRLTPKQVLEDLKSHPDLKSAMPVVYGEAFLLSSSGASEGVAIRGVPVDLVREVLDLESFVVHGHWEDFREGGLILGEGLSRALGVEPGMSITLLLNRAEYTPMGIVPKMRRLSIADSFSSGLSQFDARTAYLSLDAAERLFERKAQSVELRVRDVRRIEAVKEELSLRYAEDARVTDWLSQNQGILSALRLEKIVMGIILGLIILVAAFNICGSLIMIVRDKTRDIAILKSMGCGYSMIQKIFFLQGIFIGLSGTVVGVLLGLAASWILKHWIRFPLDPTVYMISQVPVDTRYGDVLLVIFGALVISAIATYYPARLAAKLEPTRGLKYE
ncbi:MAG: ABC transporter permease [Bradymonadales bacterium]|nr:MAG: ABC transporter permease [Bradymonadales bacterium]